MLFSERRACSELLKGYKFMKVKRVLLFTFMFSYFVTVLFPAQTYASFLDVLGLESGQTYYIRNSDSGRYFEAENGRTLENQNVRTGDRLKLAQMYLNRRIC